LTLSLGVLYQYNQRRWRLQTWRWWTICLCFLRSGAKFFPEEMANSQ